MTKTENSSFLGKMRQRPVESGLWALILLFAVAFLSVMLCPPAAGLLGGWLGTGDSKQETLQFIGFGMGGLLAAIGAFALNRRADAQIQSAQAQAESAQAQKMIAEAQNESARAAIESNKSAENRYINDQHNAAMQQLGHERDDIRIAAYYSLFRLAKLYEELREIVFTQLCAHLRQITTASNYAGKKEPTEGVQTLLDLLFKTDDRQTIFHGLKANLRRVHLAGADLAWADLSRADFTDANLQRVIFEFTELQCADFTRAKMHGAKLYQVRMQEARLHQTVLQFVTISLTDMVCASLRGADFRGAHLELVDMQCSSWYSVDFRGARLESVNLHQCDLQRGKFNGCISIDYPHDSFESRILGRAESQGDLDECVVRGGMERKQVERTAERIADISQADADKFRAEMEEHIGIPEEKLTEEECQRRGIQLSAYTEEEAEEWIAEYKEVTGETSGSGK